MKTGSGGWMVSFACVDLERSLYNDIIMGGGIFGGDAALSTHFVVKTCQSGQGFSLILTLMSSNSHFKNLLCTIRNQ